MKRLHDFTPGQVALIHQRYFATVWAKWEKVGQHQRTWYLVSPMDTPRPTAAMVSEDFLELVEGEVVTDRRPLTLVKLPEESQGKWVYRRTNPDQDLGRAYAMVSMAAEGEYPAQEWSLALDGSGYPWWLVAQRGDLVLVSYLSLRDYPLEAALEVWKKHVGNSPLLSTVS